MSDYRIGIIAEGPTDIIIIEKIIETLLCNFPIVCIPISPTPQEIIDCHKEEGFGWGGVYRICKKLSEKLEFLEAVDAKFNILIVHVDGDVMFLNYPSARIDDAENMEELPCYNQELSINNNCDNFKSIPESVKFMIFDNQLAYCKLV